jgi:hypothetical protein
VDAADAANAVAMFGTDCHDSLKGVLGESPTE